MRLRVDRGATHRENGHCQQERDSQNGPKHNIPSFFQAMSVMGLAVSKRPRKCELRLILKKTLIFQTDSPSHVVQWHWANWAGFSEAIRIAQKEFDRHQTQVIAGSSLGD
jgi:hypothetical protein